MLFCSKKNLPNYLVNRAACHFRLGNYISSLQDTTKALEYDINYERAYEQLMDLYLHFYDFAALEDVLNILQSININNEAISKARSIFCDLKTKEKQAAEFGRLKDFKNAILVINSALKVGAHIQHFILLKIKYTRKLEKLNEVWILIFIIIFSFIEE